MARIKGEDRISDIEVYQVDLTQDKPYLGPLRSGEAVSRQGYFVRKENRTVYTINNRSIVVRLITEHGLEGWGETYGIVAPGAVAAIINDLLHGFLIGRDPHDVGRIYEDLYDLMRVRGYTGGFYHDALAAIDIALWDVVGKMQHKPLTMMLGGKVRNEVPAYISGLPRATLDERVDLAVKWQQRGFDKFKFALPVADQGPVVELKDLRSNLGPAVHIACDMHWSRDRAEAVTLADHMSAYQPWFLEAPVPVEDVEGLTWVAKRSPSPIAVGEAWRTIYDAKLRIDRAACHIVQPEMAHTGVTQFLRISQYAQAHNLLVIPHATIGAGIFLAASLQVSSTLRNVDCHEYQHSLFDDFLHLTTGEMSCAEGAYQLPSGFGIGVEPTEKMWSKMKRL